MPKNVQTTALISHTSKVMLKTLQVRRQEYLNHKIPDIQAGFRKGRRIRDQITNIHWIIEKQGNSRKTSSSALLGASLVAQSTCLQWQRPGFHPWVGKILWKKKWQPTSVLLPGKFHGWRSLTGCSQWGCKESDTTERIHFLSFFFWFIDCAKAFDCVDHNKLWKILQEMGTPDHLSCLLRNLYAGQESTVRTGRGKTDWF